MSYRRFLEHQRALERLATASLSNGIWERKVIRTDIPCEDCTSDVPHVKLKVIGTKEPLCPIQIGLRVAVSRRYKDLNPRLVPTLLIIARRYDNGHEVHG